jgi:outer membrane lipoprotein-sorting protein
VKKILALLLFLFPNLSFANNLTDVLANMETRERQTKALRFNYEQIIRFTAMETVSTVRGTAVVAKQGRFRIEKKIPEEQLIVSNGKNLAVYTPSFKQMWKGPWKGWQKASMVPKGFVPLNDFAADLRENFNVSLVPVGVKEGFVGLKASPKIENAGYFFELLVSPQSWLVEEVKFVSDTAEIITSFSNIEKDPMVAENLFSISVPKGVEVIPLN